MVVNYSALCTVYFMLTTALFSVYLSINSEYYLFLIDWKIGILIAIITKYCAKPLIRQVKTVQYKKEQSDLLTHKNKATQHHEWGFWLWNGMRKLSSQGWLHWQFHTPLWLTILKSPCRRDVRPDCPSGGDMEFNGARQAIKDINDEGELRAINWLAWNMTTPATRNKPLRSPTKSLRRH